MSKFTTLQEPESKTLPGRKKKHFKLELIGAHIHPLVINKIEEIAITQKVTRSEIVRLALISFIEKITGEKIEIEPEQPNIFDAV